jgi:predicted nucleic acid-binding protein
MARETDNSYADAYIAVTAKDAGAGVVTFNRKHFSKLGATLYQFD